MVQKLRYEEDSHEKITGNDTRLGPTIFRKPASSGRK